MPSNPQPDLTEHQQRVLDTVNAYINEWGLPPTVRELADMLGVQTSAAHRALGRLRDAGRVEWDDGQHRSLRVL